MRFTLYDFTFAIFLIFTALAIAGSAASLIFQARLTGGAEANWNVFVVVGSYLALGIVSLVILVSRRSTGLKRLQTIPKAYVAVKKGDVPKQVHKLIADEYTRACLILALSQPPEDTPQEGWWRPEPVESSLTDFRFRTAILNTVSTVDSFARELVPKLPALAPTRPMRYHLRAFENILSQHDPSALIDYSDLVDQARFDEKEPTKEAWERCQEIVEQMKTILEFYRSPAAHNRNRARAHSQVSNGVHDWTLAGRGSLDTAGSMSLY